MILQCKKCRLKIFPFTRKSNRIQEKIHFSFVLKARNFETYRKFEGSKRIELKKKWYCHRAYTAKWFFLFKKKRKKKPVNIFVNRSIFVSCSCVLLLYLSFSRSSTSNIAINFAHKSWNLIRWKIVNDTNESNRKVYPKKKIY